MANRTKVRDAKLKGLIYVYHKMTASRRINRYETLFVTDVNAAVFIYSEYRFIYPS
jgi:hypothetical protein